MTYGSLVSLTLFAFGAAGHAQLLQTEIKMHGYASTPLNVVSDQQSDWKILKAELRENLANTWGVLQVQNSSNKQRPEEGFFAEYYDRRGNNCLTLVFSSRVNSEHLAGDVQSLEVRELLSLANSLGPASDPVTVRIRAVPLSGAAPVLMEIESGAPATLSGGVPDKWRTLRLPPSARSGTPVDDLLFAKVHITKRGRPERVEVVAAANPEVGAMLSGLIEELYFLPASEESGSDALILIRAMDKIDGDDDPSTFLTRRAPWIETYARETLGDELLPVTTLFYVATEQIRPMGEPLNPSPPRSEGTHTAFESGSGWSENVFGLVWDSESSRFTRVWSPLPREIR